MRLKLNNGLTLALLFVCAACPALAQSVEAATEAKLPLAVGGGFSAYNPDYGNGHLLGIALWVDYTPNKVPQVLRGIGIEAEARDLNYGRSSDEPANLREDVGGGGVIYSWRSFRNFRPYGKFLMGFGNTDWETPNSETGKERRFNQTRTVTSIGGGVEFRAFRNVWARADYEYQFWPDFFFNGAGKPDGKLNPQGFTVGAMYHFSHPHFR
jgi:opacity protein-like surface antigen